MRVILLLFAFGAIAMSGTAHAEDKGPVRVVFETEKGNFEVELYPDKAPITVANFLRYVDAKMYDDGRFHRTVTANNQPNSPVKIAVIQAKSTPGREKDVFDPIKLERTRDTKLSHKDGTISMARDGADTGQDEFFICIGAQPDLDFGGKRNADGQGFAAFGQVVRGMDVVKKIHECPAEGQFLKPAIKITRAVRK
jgi:peptidyl-prolyl cis-trans isomerase A (cyclophilin A)